MRPHKAISGSLWQACQCSSCAFCADALHTVHCYVGHEMSQNCENMVTGVQAKDNVSMTC